MAEVFDEEEHLWPCHAGNSSPSWRKGSQRIGCHNAGGASNKLEATSCYEVAFNVARKKYDFGTICEVSERCRAIRNLHEDCVFSPLCYVDLHSLDLPWRRRVMWKIEIRLIFTLRAWNFLILCAIARLLSLGDSFGPPSWLAAPFILRRPGTAFLAI